MKRCTLAEVALLPFPMAASVSDITHLTAVLLGRTLALFFVLQIHPLR